MSYFHIIWIVDVYFAFVEGGKLNSIFVFGWYESRSHRIGAHDFVGVGAEMSQRYMHLVISGSVCIFFLWFCNCGMSILYVWSDSDQREFENWSYRLDCVLSRASKYVAVSGFLYIGCQGSFECFSKVVGLWAHFSIIWNIDVCVFRSTWSKTS